MIFLSPEGVVVNIDLKRKVARVTAPNGDLASKILRNILAKDKKIKIESVIYSPAVGDKITALIRGPALKNWLKPEGKNRSKAPPLGPKDQQKGVGATIVAYCVSTKRFLMHRRAETVPDGGKIGMFGGRSEESEMPQQTAVREFSEEAGIEISPANLYTLWTYETDTFFLHNFLLLVKDEFKCTINPAESQEYMWIDHSKFAELPMQEGTLELFKNDDILKNIVSTRKDKDEINFTQLVDDIMPITVENDDPIPA